MTHWNTSNWSTWNTSNPLTTEEKSNIRRLANRDYAISRSKKDTGQAEFYRGRAVGMGKVAQLFNPVRRKNMRRSEITKAAWRRRKRAGGKATCAFCHKPIFAGGVSYQGMPFHKTCLEEMRYGLTPAMAGVANPRMRNPEILKIKGASPSAVADAVVRALMARGFTLHAYPMSSTKVNISNVRVDPKVRGYNISPYTEHRGSVLGWNDWVEFNNTVNDVLDSMGVSAKVQSLKGKFPIRDGTRRYVEEDWVRMGLHGENVWRHENPQEYSDFRKAIKSEDRARQLRGMRNPHRSRDGLRFYGARALNTGGGTAYPANLVRSTKNPRPPAGWWAQMWPKIAAQYPKKKGETIEHYKKAINTIVAGIWWKYPQKTKDRLIRYYDRDAVRLRMLNPVSGLSNPRRYGHYYSLGGKR